jgi:hypothetical protein
MGHLPDYFSLVLGHEKLIAREIWLHTIKAKYDYALGREVLILMRAIRQNFIEKMKFSQGTRLLVWLSVQSREWKVLVRQRIWPEQRHWMFYGILFQTVAISLEQEPDAQVEEDSSG